MPNTTLRRPALNIPLLVLWAVTVGVLAVGLWMLQAGNAAQAEFYTNGDDDYLEYLNLQTQSTVGGFLVVAGVIGVLLALATHAGNRAGVLLAKRPASVDDANPENSDEADDDDAEAFELNRTDATATTEPEQDSADAPREGPAPTENETETSPEPVRA